jgi:hypothetical protein
VALQNVEGHVTIRTTHAEIAASNVTGSLEIDADHTEVAVSRVGALRLKTTHDDVAVRDVAGPVDVENQHGKIDVRLPLGQRYNITTEVNHGDVRIDRSFDRGPDGRAVNLRTSFDDIIVKPSAARSSDADPS